MAAQDLRSEDLRVLDVLRPLERFREIAETGGNLGSLAMVADSVGRALEAVKNDKVKQRIEELIEKERAAPVVDFEDYGRWRSKHNNADYSEYVKARESEASRIPRLQSALDNIKWIKNTNESVLEQFSSIDELIKVCSSLNRFVGEMRSAGESETLIAQSIDTRDISLCIGWSNTKADTGSELKTLSEILGSYEASRLLSARAAEKVVALYYRSLGEEVKDISATQLENTGDQWKDFDLLVGGRPIDVKNARRSFSSPDTYVEHCVPRFKRERVSGADVSIAGVLSDYGTEDELLSGELRCQILGEVSVSGIRNLYSWMRRRFGVTLNLDGLWRQGYVPGWMFEYPEVHYAHRRRAIAGLADVLSDVRRVCKSAEERIPGWLLTLCSNHGAVESLNVSKMKKRILRDLRSLDSEIGLSRPSLFLYVMGVMLESMLVGSSSEETADTIRDLLFFDDDAARPLFLSDTQKYVANLIDLLSRVHQEAIRTNYQFTGFLMPHPSILQGQRDSLIPMTLIAYCGGWREVPTRVKCGAAPLFLGGHQSCPSCSHLICDKCGHCSDSCSLVIERQANVTKASVRLYE